MENKVKLANKIYPWFAGLSSDLIFFIAINSIWLTTVKGFSFAEITFFTTVSSLFGIVFQFPSLIIIKKMGNTNSIRFGSFLLLVASIMLTFCTKYISFIMANIFYEMAFVFTLMSSVLIKNNLNYLSKNEEYVKIRSKASLIYAVATAFITLLSGILFNLYNYLPMILGIINSLACLVMSFLIFDVDEKISFTKEMIKEERKLLIPRPFKLFLLILFFYAMMFGIIVIGQQDSKLLIQSELLNILSVSKTATYIGIIMFISRLLRIVVNYFYPKLYNVMKDKMIILLGCSLLCGLIILLIGYYLNVNIYIKIFIMVGAFSCFPSLRDPVNIYIQNLLLEKFSKEYQKDTMIYLSLSKHIGQFIISSVATIILLKFPLQYLFFIFSIILVFLILLTFKIKKILENNI